MGRWTLCRPAPAGQAGLVPNRRTSIRSITAESKDVMGESADTIRIFLLDDHEVVRRGIAELLDGVPGFEIVGEAGTAEQAVQRAVACRPDVAVLDMRL